MNIFFLSDVPTIAARAHCNTHVVKMIVETAQILSTVVRSKIGDEIADSIKLFKATHPQHPCTVWAGASAANFSWLLELGVALCGEYSFRYRKTHSTTALLCAMSQNGTDELGLTDAGLTVPPAVVYPAYLPKGTPSLDKTIEAYRAMYGGMEKRHLMKFTRRAPPEWLTTPEGWVFEEDITRWVVKGDQAAMRLAAKVEEKRRHQTT